MFSPAFRLFTSIPVSSTSAFGTLLPLTAFGRRIGCRISVPHTGLHFHAKGFIKSCPVPLERPRQSCKSHSQQEDKCIHSARHMQVVPKTTPTFIRYNLQTVLQCLARTRPPNDYTRYQYKHEHQRTGTDNHLPPEDAAILLHAVQQPTVHPEHKVEKGRSFIFTHNLTRILIHIHRCTTGFGKCDLVSPFRIRRNINAGY